MRDFLQARRGMAVMGNGFRRWRSRRENNVLMHDAKAIDWFTMISDRRILHTGTTGARAFVAPGDVATKNHLAFWVAERN